MATPKANKKFNYQALAKDIYNTRNKSTIGSDFRTVAAKLNISYSTLYRLEAMSVKPDIDTLATVCNWIGKPLQSYFQ